VIAVTSRSAKPVGSRAGMEISRRTSPFYNEWVANADADLAIAQAAVLAHDFAALAAVSEHNCLKMHAVMMSSRPSLMYWNAATLECIHRIRALRERDGVRVFFTIDAGPQVKAVCMPEDAERVATALAETPGVATVLRSRLGHGARLLRESEMEIA
jgi:diphosphomevalonate decarboxylase